MCRDSIEDLFLLDVMADLDDVFGTGMHIIEDLEEPTLIIFVFDIEWTLRIQLYEEKEEYEAHEIIEYEMLPNLILDKLR